MSTKTPPHKLNIADIGSGPAMNNSHHHSQGIAALFAITFDLRAGYTITWQQPEGTAHLFIMLTVDMDISGVEFKSLPSGLHNINEDLVYFVMPPYAGLSAYYRKEAPESERNTRMVAIGVLVPSTGRYGRLGRAWDHAPHLKALAQTYADNPDDTSYLQSYFDNHYDPIIPTSATPETPNTLRYSPKHFHPQTLREQTVNRKRSISDTAVPFRGLKLSPFHPAMTFPDLITTFGPLIFVLYRAALCRKLYNTSVLATLPPSVSDLLVNEPNRLRTLFSVGVSDIPMLEELSSDFQSDTATLNTISSSEIVNEHGWVACTTDAVLALKPHLYDILITLPHRHSFPSMPSSTVKIPQENNHPTLTTSSGETLLPTLRDLRRWKRLLLEMPLPKPSGPDPDFDDLGYECTWTEFICSGLFWWATAGEASLAKEFDTDGSDDEYFLSEPPARRGTFGEEVPLLQRSDTTDSFITPVIEARTQTHSDTLLRRTTTGFGEADVGVMVYFHRMTARMVSSLSAIIDANELTEDSDVETPVTKISMEDLMRMGIDWSERGFVREMCRTWFGREVKYENHRSGCCY